MLQGVEILSQEVVPIMETSIIPFVVCALISVMLALFIGLLINNVYIAVLIYVVEIIIAIVMDINSQVPTGEYTKYKVTISDTVNFVEFNEKYEVLEQDGKIYTIKERIDD